MYQAHLIHVYIYVGQTLEQFIFFCSNIDQLKLEIYTIL